MFTTSNTHSSSGMFADGLTPILPARAQTTKQVSRVGRRGVGRLRRVPAGLSRASLPCTSRSATGQFAVYQPVCHGPVCRVPAGLPRASLPCTSRSATGQFAVYQPVCHGPVCRVPAGLPRASLLTFLVCRHFRHARLPSANPPTFKVWCVPENLR